MNNLWVWLLQHVLPRRFWYRRLYMRSAHWQQMKREYKFSMCQRCGSEFDLQLHHKTYYNRKGQSILWREQDRHFETLCGQCHRQAHGR